MSVQFDFGRVSKWGAMLSAAALVGSCTVGCVGDRADDRRLDAEVTKTMLAKGEGSYNVNVGGVERTGVVRAGKPVVYRSSDPHGHGRGTPVLLNGPDEVCLVGRFKVVGGVDNLPFYKWAGIAAADLTKTVHRNPSNIGLDCATGVESIGPAPTASAPGMR